MATVNIYDMADTWNDGGTTFTAIKMDVTDTSSASDSLLMDLKVGGTSQFKVRKNGLVTSLSYFGGLGIRDDDSYYAIGQAWSGVRLSSSYFIAWGSSSAGSVADLFLTRKTGANLRLGAADAAGPVAQTLSVQSVVAGTSNTAGQDFTIQGSAGTGSGAGGSIIFQVAPAGGSGTGQNTLVDALTINSSKSLILNNYNSNPYAGLAFPISGTYSVGLYQPADYTFRISMSNASAGGQISSAYQGFNFQIDSAILSWGLTSLDIVLARDAANTLALRNGANAQEFRVYKTETGTVYKALLGDNNLIKISGEAFTDGAGASTGTLTNAPAVGNPTKWIPIDDNGTTRYIPAW